jgi:hypothetical protein
MRAYVLGIMAMAIGLHAGCGKVEKIGADGGGDGDPDAAAPGQVSVTVFDLFGEGSGPISGATVLLLDADGEIVVETTTDAEGRAGGTTGGNSTLVLLLPPSANPSGSFQNISIAVLGVQPGDDIVIADEERGSGTSDSMLVELPFLDGVTRYEIAIGCGFASSADKPTLQVFVEDICLEDGQFDFLGMGRDSLGNVIAFFPGRAQFVPGGAVSPAGDWSSPASVQLALRGLPAIADTLRLEAFPLLGGRDFGSTFSFEQPVGASELTVVAPLPVGFGDGRLVSLGLRSSQPAVGEQIIQILTAPDTGAVDLDVDELLLPWYGPVLFSTPDRSLVWSRSAGRSPDAQYAFFLWQEAGGIGGGAWFFVAPPDVDRVAVPPLPERFASRLPVEPVSVFAQLFAVDASIFDSFDQARQRAFEPLYEDAASKFPVPGHLVRSVPPGGDL